MNLYVDIVCQVTQIFDMGMTFALGLVNAMKKNKSFEIELWTKDQINLLMAPIERYIRAARMGKT